MKIVIGLVVAAFLIVVSVSFYQMEASRAAYLKCLQLSHDLLEQKKSDHTLYCRP